MPDHVLCSLTELSDPGAKGPFRVGNTSVFVVRQGDRVRAYVDSCPHAFAPLEMEPDQFLDLTRSYVLCSLHGAHFDPDSGACVLGPCLGRSLTAYPIRIHNGKIIAGPQPDGI
ncbi:MAG: Rieske (2Fe-2S) protein [Magnetospirillum sp.]|nr:Rieske (2Fe-2S) protein [Magnetospirillum sp.]